MTSVFNKLLFEIIDEINNKLYSSEDLIGAENAIWYKTLITYLGEFNYPTLLIVKEELKELIATNFRHNFIEVIKWLETTRKRVEKY